MGEQCAIERSASTQLRLGSLRVSNTQVLIETSGRSLFNGLPSGARIFSTIIVVLILGGVSASRSFGGFLRRCLERRSLLGITLVSQIQKDETASLKLSTTLAFMVILFRLASSSLLCLSSSSLSYLERYGFPSSSSSRSSLTSL